jgi:drug/metabolite transporter (DMT)-like permease
MLTAVGVFALMDAQLKLLVERYPPFEVTSLRGFAALPFVLAHVVMRGRINKLMPHSWRWHLLRAVIAIAMMAGFIYSVKHLSLADTYAIYMSAPLMIAALSVPLLRERIGAGQWAAIVVGLCGVLLMLRPGTGNWATAAALAAMGSAVCYALSAITLRKLSLTETTESLVFSFTLMMALASLLIALPTWQPLRLADLHWIIGVGLCGAIAQFLVTEAFRRGPASVIAPFEYTALLWGMLLDLVVWHVRPSAITIAGAMIVIGAGIYLIRREAGRTPEASMT